MNWLDTILDQHSSYESPRNFWFWASLSAVSAVLKDNVYLDKYLYKLYPNIYVMLHADSGLRKGAPVSMAKQLVNEVGNTRVIGGRSSIQGIMKKLGTSETKPGGHIVKDACGFLCWSEMSASIVEDRAAMGILTDLYDRNLHEDYESLLKLETFNLKKPTITMLTATNEAHSNAFFIQRDIQGGYFARTFIIYENKRQSINSLMFKPDKIANYKELACYLKELAKLKGAMEIDHSTRVYFDEWYKEFTNTIDVHEIKDPTGTMRRFDDSVLKVAILISLAEQPELKITQSAVERAIEECERLIGNVRKVTFHQGSSSYAEHQSMVLKELFARDNHTISRQQLLRKFGAYALSKEWDEIMLSLEGAGIIKIENQGNVVLFKMNKDNVEQLKRHFMGKNE